MSKHGNWYSGKIGDGDFGACKLQGSRRTIWGPASKFHCDLGDLFHYLRGLGHSSLFICVKDVGGNIVGNSGDCSQLQALPKSYSNLNFKKQQKQAQAPGCLWLACQEGRSYRLTLRNHLDGKEDVGSGSFKLSPEQNSFVGFPG